jgi:hypothetical protein
VEEIIRLKNLEKLNLSFTDISEHSLLNLRKLPHLVQLVVEGNGITEEHIKKINQQLSTYCNIMIDPLVHPRDFTSLPNIAFSTERGEATTALTLQGAQVTDQKLIRLRGMRNIQALAFEGTNVTGAGMKHLQRHEFLALIIFKDTPLKDDELMRVGAMIPNLRFVILDKTAVTPNGAKEFRMKYPVTPLVVLN